MENRNGTSSVQAQEDHIEHIAQNLLNREILICQSSLIEWLLRVHHEDEAWSWENIYNLWPNTEDWLFHKCYQMIAEEGLQEPEPNPYKMQRSELIEMIETADKSPLDGSELEYLDDEMLRSTVIKLINEKIVYGLDEWRSYAAQGQPQEVFEWWAITDWLTRHLKEINEPVLINDYGNWWGRTCTGQGIMQDGTLQKVARRIL